MQFDCLIVFQGFRGAGVEGLAMWVGNMLGILQMVKEAISLIGF